jgi:hypothetical protein
MRTPEPITLDPLDEFTDRLPDLHVVPIADRVDVDEVAIEEARQDLTDRRLACTRRADECDPRHATSLTPSHHVEPATGSSQVDSVGEDSTRGHSHTR